MITAKELAAMRSGVERGLANMPGNQILIDFLRLITDMEQVARRLERANELLHRWHDGWSRGEECDDLDAPTIMYFREVL